MGQRWKRRTLAYLSIVSETAIPRCVCRHSPTIFPRTALAVKQIKQLELLHGKRLHMMFEHCSLEFTRGCVSSLDWRNFAEEASSTHCPPQELAFDPDGRYYQTQRSLRVATLFYLR